MTDVRPRPRDDSATADEAAPPSSPPPAPARTARRRRPRWRARIAAGTWPGIGTTEAAVAAPSSSPRRRITTTGRRGLRSFGPNNNRNNHHNRGRRRPSRSTTTETARTLLDICLGANSTRLALFYVIEGEGGEKGGGAILFFCHAVRERKCGRLYYGRLY